MQWLVGVMLSVVVVWGAPTDDEEAKGQIWAVLVAGSNEYHNYRHQAGICHAYQIFHRHGIPDTNIIVMMYDDIAMNEENPRKGVIINKPGGPNVYGPKDVPKDYTNDTVTSDNFINILTGNSTGVEGVGSRKVLKSGPKDHVFVNFVDHGGAGIIVFPNGYLYADDLIKALKTMHKKKMYKRLVFYLETSASGSMFSTFLPKNMNILATTAANTYEGSHAVYWDDTVKAFIGGEYGVSWMEDIDSEEHQKNITTETLEMQFQNVVKRVNQSHPSMYGETTFQKDRVKNYFGVSKDTHNQDKVQTRLERFHDSVSARDVLLRTLNRKIKLANSIEDKESLQKKREHLLKGRKEVDELFARILDHVTNSDEEHMKALEQEHQPLSLEMMPCYKTLVDTFNSYCVNINKNTYVLGQLYKFANLCATEYTTPEVVLEAFKAECGAAHRALDGVH